MIMIFCYDFDDPNNPHRHHDDDDDDDDSGCSRSYHV